VDESKERVFSKKSFAHSQKKLFLHGATCSTQENISLFVSIRVQIAFKWTLKINPNPNLMNFGQAHY
jgi:hypothetical protein